MCVTHIKHDSRTLFVVENIQGGKTAKSPFFKMMKSTELVSWNKVTSCQTKKQTRKYSLTPGNSDAQIEHVLYLSEALWWMFHSMSPWVSTIMLYNVINNVTVADCMGVNMRGDVASKTVHLYQDEWHIL